MTPLAGAIILALFYLGRLRRQDGEDGRGHPAPRQGALLAPWNPG